MNNPNNIVIDIDANKTKAVKANISNDPVLGEYYERLKNSNSIKQEDNMQQPISENKNEIINIVPNEPTTAVIGIGQCGGNIAHRARIQGFLTCAVNTSKEDLSGCITDLKFEFKNAGGSGKERSRSKNIFASNLDEFNKFFQDKFSNIKNVVIVASAAGGTGGGSAPMCARFLKDNYPNKNIFLIMSLGSIYEDIKSQENMLSVLEELNKCEVNYLLFDNDRSSKENVNEIYDQIDSDIIDAIRFISRQYFEESSVSNIDVADMQKLYLENKRMIIVTGKFDTKVSNKIDPNQQIINAINNSTQIPVINNPMSYALFLSTKSSSKNYVDKLDKELRFLVDEFGEPYEIYKHYQEGPENAPDFAVCITGLDDCVDRYTLINDRLSEFNERMNNSKKLSDVNKVTINARSQSGVTLPEEIIKDNKSPIDKSSLDMFM